jgi:non-specific serine/threonine protein kinase/serine/threonine-protein kinase
MSQPDWGEVDRVMAAVLELPEEARPAYLAERCAHSPELRAEVESLLAADCNAGDFLRAATGWGGIAPSLPGSLAGRSVGPYRLLAEIGRGGMGAVYRAERDDGRFRKQVAVKVTTALNSSELLRRFRVEQQILAALEHPNIARLLDAGVSNDGLPYIVMEYVEGIPIHRYANELRLPLADRLRLFRVICSAVQYAHQHLVVHRDLKPGNILVTTEGVPKLLDFGVAKILGAWLEDDGLTASLNWHPMTPEYASPEQIRGANIATTSDVYSLGALLYELLTGVRPFLLAGLTLEQATRVVCAQEPKKPSTAAGRHDFVGDLDAIVLKAMRKEPDQRYASAEELSADIGRYMERRPVLAHRNSFRYVARKFVGRHRLGVVTAAVAALLAVAGGAGILLQARVADRQRTREETRFNEVRSLAHSFLFEVYDSILSLPGSTAARQLVSSRAQRYLDSLAREAADDSSLAQELAESYLRLGDVRGSPYSPNLGDTEGALESYRKAQSILEPAFAHASSDSRLGAQLCQALESIGRILVRKGLFEQAETVERRALPILDALSASNPDEPHFRMLHANALNVLGQAQVQFALAHPSVEGFMRAQEWYRKSLQLHEVAGPPFDEEWQRGLSSRYFFVSYPLWDSGDLTGKRSYYQEALEYQLRGLAISRRLLQAHPGGYRQLWAIADNLREVGWTRGKCGDLAGAIRDYREALDRRIKLAQADPQNMEGRRELANVYRDIGRTLAEAGNTAGAMDNTSKALNIYEELNHLDPQSHENSLYLADVHARMQSLKSKGN